MEAGCWLAGAGRWLEPGEEPEASKAEEKQSGQVRIQKERNKRQTSASGEAYLEMDVDTYRRTE